MLILFTFFNPEQIDTLPYVVVFIYCLFVNAIPKAGNGLSLAVTLHYSTIYIGPFVAPIVVIALIIMLIIYIINCTRS